MTRSPAAFLIAVLGLPILRCPLVGDPTPTVDACVVWEAANTDRGWLTVRTSLAEIEQYLREKRVACAGEIFAMLKEHDRQGFEFWRLHNPLNRPPALADGYAVVADRKVVISFYKLW